MSIEAHWKPLKPTRDTLHNKRWLGTDSNAPSIRVQLSLIFDQAFQTAIQRLRVGQWES